MKRRPLVNGRTVWLASGLLALGTLSAPATDEARVYVLGDSMARALATSVKNQLKTYPGVAAESYVSLGSGLARYDLFDWTAKLQEVVGTRAPVAVVMMIGAADNQGTESHGRVLAFGTPEWIAEYSRRTGAAMDLLIQGGVKRIVWIVLPPMREEKTTRDLEVINRIFRQQAQSRSAVRLLDADRLLSQTPGKFSPYIVQKNGMPLQVRSTDGKHLDTAGGDLLARAAIAEFEELLKPAGAAASPAAPRDPGKGTPE